MPWPRYQFSHQTTWQALISFCPKMPWPRYQKTDRLFSMCQILGTQQRQPLPSFHENTVGKNLLHNKDKQYTWQRRDAAVSPRDARGRDRELGFFGCWVPSRFIRPPWLLQAQWWMVPSHQRMAGAVCNVGLHRLPTDRDGFKSFGLDSCIPVCTVCSSYSYNGDACIRAIFQNLNTWLIGVLNFCKLKKKICTTFCLHQINEL
jgi:hypothetical protein